MVELVFWNDLCLLLALPVHAVVASSLEHIPHYFATAFFNPAHFLSSEQLDRTSATS
jgi:hypothetical protein